MGGFYLMVALGCGATQLILGVVKVARLLSRLAACTVTERIRVYGLAVANKNGVLTWAFLHEVIFITRY